MTEPGRLTLRGALGAPLRLARVAFLRLVGLLAAGPSKTVGTPRRILILQLQQLGDSVVFSPTLRAIRERFPDAELDLLTSPIASQLYAKSPYPSRIFRADRWGTREHGTRLLPLVPLIRKLRARRYDWVIADATQHSFKYSLIAFAIGAPVRIGFDVDSRGRLFTHRLALPSDAPLALCNLAIACVVGANAQPRPEEISFDAEDTSRIDALLRERGIAQETRVVLIHPGSNWQSKLWYADRFAKVADAVAMRSHCCIVFVGTAGETVEVEATRSAMHADSVSLVGATSLTELAALCARASLFIGTDSGPRNVAGAVGTRTVVVVSAQEDTSRWFGYRAGELAVRASARCIGCYYSRCAHRLCMRAISENDVIELTFGEPPARRQPASALPVINVPVPESLYVAVAGSPDADCASLRRLARAPST